MARTFDHVDNKLFEADFFFQKMAELDFNWFEMRCFFSAFVNSSRSVTFALQASMNGVSGFSEWYTLLQEKLRQDKLARFFHECRTDDQKIGYNHVVGGWSENGTMKYWFGEPQPGQYSFIPNVDVLTACKLHITKLCEIVDEVYFRFGLEIDPDQRYTPEGVNKLGISLEDIEALCGFPPGWTDIDWHGPGKDEIRLELLRRSIPGSSVKPLLIKYLGRELRYPVGRFRSEYGKQQL
jgi:hypothetical protein